MLAEFSRLVGTLKRRMPATERGILFSDPTRLHNAKDHFNYKICLYIYKGWGIKSEILFTFWNNIEAPKDTIIKRLISYLFKDSCGWYETRRSYRNLFFFGHKTFRSVNCTQYRKDPDSILTFLVWYDSSTFFKCFLMIDLIVY